MACCTRCAGGHYNTADTLQIPPLTTDEANTAADVFVPDAKVSSLPQSYVRVAQPGGGATGLRAPLALRRVCDKAVANRRSQADEARNLTLAILSVPQPNRNVSFAISLNSSVIANFSIATDARGEIDSFVPLNASSLPSGAGDGPITRLDVQTNDTQLGNSSLFLVPRQGYTLVSDIDDIRMSCSV